MVVVQKQFFPYAERLELFLQIRMPEGSSIGATLKTAKQAEELLKDDSDVDFFTTYVGQGPPRFWLGLNPQLPNEAYAETVIVSKDVPARERLKKRLEAAIGNGALPEARVRVDRFSYGPPVGFAVQFRVIGPTLRKCATSPIKSATSWSGTPASTTRISPGTSRRRACASSSIRTAPVSWASRRRTSPTAFAWRFPASP
jgi:multidrug efflux pump subunit AcrB